MTFIAFRLPTVAEQAMIHYFVYCVHLKHVDVAGAGDRCVSDCPGCEERRREHDPGDAQPEDSDVEYQERAAWARRMFGRR